MMNRKKLIFFSGTSNLPLAEKIAKRLEIPLGKVEIKRFSDGECRVWVREETAKQDVFILQSLSTVADKNLMEVCLIGNAVSGMGAKTITGVIPWMGYSKQDKEFRHGEAISSQLVAKFLETAGFNKIITVDLHSSLIKKYFKIPVLEVSAKKLLGERALSKEVDAGENFIVISPDKGGVSRSDAFAKYLNLPVAHLDKTRDLVSGKVTIHSIDKNIKGKETVIFDDMINTGSTAIETAKYLKEKGAKKVLFLATHAILCGEAAEKLQVSVIDKVVITDTIFIPKEKLFSKLIVVSVAELIIKAIQNG